MRRVIIIGLFLFGFSEIGFAEVVDGTMNCSVVDQAIVDITDGKPQRFDAIRGGARVGDTFSIIYQSYTGGTREHVIFMFGNGESDENNSADINKVVRYNLVNADIKDYQDFLVITEAGRPGDYRHKLVISPDFFILHNGETKFQRYANGRWMGMNAAFVRSSTTISSKTLSFDCANMNPGSFKSIYNSLIRRNKG